MKLELHERKNTTTEGLEELQALIDTFDEKFDADIQSVNSFNFFGEFDCDNDLYGNDFNFREWKQTECYWKISDGVIELMSELSEIEHDSYNRHAVSITSCNKLDFAKCLDELENVIKKYNEELEKKDTQIQEFLDFCVEYNKS